jgi:hypothetical protein
LAECDGSSADILLSQTCLIPLTSFRQDPFNLAIGDHIYVKVIAVNAFGESINSNVGDGAEVLSVPDAPVNLINIVEVTNAEAIGFGWENGVSDGGTSIIDY